MINQLDQMVRHLLDTGLNDPSLPWTIDVEVRPPDDAWRAAVNSDGRPAVNVYLVEVREARDLRSTSASLRRDAEPFRVDCHYLVSAWIPTSDPAFGTPTVVEDWLLGRCIAILSDHAPLTARDVYEGTFPSDLDPLLYDLALRTELLPPEGYARLADFWTGVGQGNTWHASAYLVVTLPILRTDKFQAPPVRTIHLTTARTGPGSSGAPAEWVEDRILAVGGVVRTSTGGPVPGALVTLSDATGVTTLRTVTTDGSGRYRLDGLVPGSYRLAAWASDLGPVGGSVDLPGHSSDYDLVLT